MADVLFNLLTEAVLALICKTPLSLFRYRKECMLCMWNGNISSKIHGYDLLRILLIVC